MHSDWKDSRALKLFIFNSRSVQHCACFVFASGPDVKTLNKISCLYRMFLMTDIQLCESVMVSLHHHKPSGIYCLGQAGTFLTVPGPISTIEYRAYPNWVLP
jgi:hypothetical protein